MENNAPQKVECKRRCPLTQIDGQKIKDGFKRWITHRQVIGFVISMVVMAIVSLAFFYPANFTGGSLQQYDMVQGAANGEEARAFQEATGEKALWTNALFSGMPTFQISPSYPSNALFSWLNTVYGLGLPAPSNLMFMMMMGMLIMLYCFRLRWPYALVGALAWGLSSYFVIIIGAGHIWKFMALTYVPPTVGALALVYRRRYFGGAALMGIFAMLELNANHPQVTYISLYLLVPLAICYLIDALRRKASVSWLKGSAAALVGGLLALGANLPSLYNTYEYSKETKRAGSELSTPATSAEAQPAERPTGGLPKSEIGGWANLPSESFSLLIPNIKGGASIKPVQGQNQPLNLDSTSQFGEKGFANSESAQFVSQFSQYFGGKGMTNGPFYVGAIIFALFLVGCFIVRGPAKWAFVFATVISVLLAMGNYFETLTDLMIYNVPMFNKFRAAETWLILAALTMPALAAMALQQLLSEEDAWKKYRIPLAVGFGIPVLLTVVAIAAPSVFGDTITSQEREWIDANLAQVHELAKQNSGYLQYITVINQAVEDAAALRQAIVSADALRSLMMVLLGLCVIVLAMKRKLTATVGAFAVGMFVVIDMYNVDKRYVSEASFVIGAPSNTHIEPDAIDRQILQDKGHYRVADFDNFGSPMRSYFHSMVGGYHAAKLRRYDDLISTGHISDPAVLDMLNTRYIIYKGQVERNDSALGNAWLVNDLRYVSGADAELAALEQIDPADTAVADQLFKEALGDGKIARSQGDYIKLVDYTPNTLTYDANTASGGLAVFSEVWFPWGWHATVDGKEVPLGRVNYVLRALRLTPGKHHIVMTFDPESIHVTSSIAYGCITVLYILALLSIFVAVTCNLDKKDD
jgi:hypothetical protein